MSERKKSGWGSIIAYAVIALVLLFAWQFYLHYSQNSKYKLEGLYELSDDAPNGGLGSPGFNLYFDYDKSISFFDNRWTVRMFTKSKVSDEIGLSALLSEAEQRKYLIRFGKMETSFVWQGNDLTKTFQFQATDDCSQIALDQWVYKKVK